jgi:translation initiation factor IF-2
MTGDGIEDLLERIFAEGELLELKAHPEGPGAGVVLEAEIQQGKGIVAHLLVQDGTLKRGDVILAGEGYGKVRAIHNDRGELLEYGGPSMPIEVTGLSALPDVGDAFHVVESLAKAKEVAEERERNSRQIAFAAVRQSSPELQAILGDGSEKERTTINLIVRADVQGSVGAIKHALSETQHEEIEVKVLHSGVGAITESDVDLASTSGATLIAFHVGVGGKSRIAAERAGVEIRRFEVIYELTDYVRELMEGSLAPDIKEEITGHVEVRRIFKSSKLGSIAGCYVLDGIVARDSKIRLLRDDKVIHTGRIGSLRREADDAREVREGFECGLLLKDYRDVREGDVVETFRQIEVKRTLDGVR